MRIAICGASGTGKTTLAKFIAESFGLVLNPVGSRSVAKKLGFDSPYDVDKAGMRGKFQQTLQAEKIQWETDAQKFVTDRTTLDELTYTTMHDVASVTQAYFDNAFSHMARYTHVIYCPVDVFCNVGDDPKRVHDMTYQRVFDCVLNGFIDRHRQLQGSFKLGPYAMTSPDLESRKRWVRDYIVNSGIG